MNKWMHNANRGLTLIELLLGMLLLVGGATALLLSMNGTMATTQYLSEFHTAMNAAQGELEQLEATDFNALAAAPEYAQARRPPGGPMGQCISMSGALSCVDDVLLPGGRLIIQIQSPDPSGELLDLHVAACWTSRGRRIGEDQNCDGQLDPAEDLNTNGWVDSPVTVSTRIARRS